VRKEDTRVVGRRRAERVIMIWRRGDVFETINCV
jgi:hypothetical protein